MAHAHGDPSAHELMRLQRQVVRECVARHDGHEVKSMGDGFMLAFASARNAVLCAMEIQRGLDAHNRRDAGRRVAVRMGLNTGEVIREEDDLFGSAIAAAERIMRKARGGEILVSERVRAVMGIAPDIELRERGRFRLKGFPERWRLYEAVWREDGHGPSAMAVAELERTPFVGRLRECETLRSAVRRAGEGVGSVVIVSGEAGVGKTRLATHVLSEAGRQGMLAVSGRCYEHVGGATYAPFAEIFESIVRSVPEDAVREAAGDWLGDIARVMPAMRRYAATERSRADDVAPGQRYDILVAVAAFFDALSAGRRMVLLIDDLQWADEGTSQLLAHLARSAREMGILIIGTVRAERGSEAAPIAKALAELQRQHLAEWIELPAFSGDGVREMLAALAGREPPEQLCDAIAAETDGVAFFVEEVFAHLKEESRLFAADGEWLPGVRVGDVSVPRGLRMVLDLRLARLSDAARAALAAAAVIGREFTPELLERVCALRDDALFDAIDECERSRVVVAADADAGDRFAFAHELMRHALLESMGTSERQRVHRRVAEALEREDAEPAQTESIAYHYVSAGRFAEPARVVAALCAAGDAAMSACAHQAASEHYRAALRMADSHRGTPARERADVLQGLGRAQYRLGELEVSEKTLDAAMEIYRAEGMTADVTETLYLRAVVCTFQARAMNALEFLADAKEIVTDGTQLHGLIHALESQNLMQLRRYDDARKAIDHAKAVASALDDTYLTVRILMASGYQRLMTLELRGAEDDFARVVSTDGIEVHERMAATSRRAMALTGLGRFEEAAAGASAAGGFFRKASDPYEQALAMTPLAVIAMAQGRFEDGRALADDAMAASGSETSRWVSGGLLPLMLQARYATGRMNEIGGMAQMLAGGDESRRPSFVVRLTEALASAAGREPVEFDEISVRRGPGRVLDQQSVVWEAMTAEIAIAARSVELASPASESLMELYGRGVLFTPGWVVLLPRVLGACAVLRGDFDEAERLLRHALEVATRCGARAEVAATHLEFGELFGARGAAGDAGSARSHLAEAQRLCAEVGATTMAPRLDRVEGRFL